MKKRVFISALALVTLGLVAFGAVAQAREGESGDDRRGHGASLTIHKSMAREPEVGDDRGRGGQEPQPGDDRGGLG